MGKSCSVEVQLFSSLSALLKMLGTGEPIKSQNQPSQIKTFLRINGLQVRNLCASRGPVTVLRINGPWVRDCLAHNWPADKKKSDDHSEL
uniref:Uncharacterized protein n=1 Tax=Timema tahoe TaxID=61484 RepID=A0A7R9IAF1_9NEOP|nr:unnamed protein product [Timema tahoe]